MFERGEAFDFIKTFLRVDNAEQRMETDRRKLLDDIIFNIHTSIPFQNIFLMSMPLQERRKPTASEVKSNFISGLGGVCFDINIATFQLLTAIGFDAVLVHSTVFSSVTFPNNHVLMYASNVEKEGDRFIVDAALGFPTFQSIDLDFEKESPVFVNSFLEYKYVKHEGKLLRMHRKGDPFTAKGVQKTTDLEFWLGDWRRFYSAELEGTKDVTAFESHHEAVYTNPEAAPFFSTHRAVRFKDGKAVMITNNRMMTDIEGKLVTTMIEGGDEEILSTIKKHFPVMTDELLHKSLQHWREAMPV